MDHRLALARTGGIVRGTERDRARWYRGRHRLVIAAGETVDHDGVGVAEAVSAAGDVAVGVCEPGVRDVEIAVALVDDGAADDAVGFDLLRGQRGKDLRQRLRA